MSEFMDRAEDEAARRDREDSDWYARQAGLLFADGATWATRQPPTDAEVEAAGAAFDEVIMSGEWVTQEQAIRAALLAAQKVRAGL